MTSPNKIVLNSVRGYAPELDDLVIGWIRDGVIFVGVVGVEAAKIESIIDELCVGDGSQPYSMLTASHGPNETLQDALFLAEQLTEEFAGPVAVIEF